jgi:tetratricopeptide (TPR) repeat protein
MAEGLENVKRMSDLTQQGQFEEALKLAAKMPDDLKKQKIVLVVRGVAASNVGESEFLAVIDDFRKHYPDDAALDLMSIDYFLNQKKHDKALTSIDRVDEAVGGDAYLDVMRAGIYAEMGDFDEALKTARRATEREEDLADAQWSIVTISLKKKDYDLTAETLNTLTKKFGIGLPDLATVEEYAGFVQSPQYKKWLEARQTPAATP